ncbi:MAG: hypothetical protein IPK82_22240 [Polyangiaceae bacterium]|nr:hypothetical protein [Polyangiaceae bacterium]
MRLQPVATARFFVPLFAGLVACQEVSGSAPTAPSLSSSAAAAPTSAEPKGPPAPGLMRLQAAIEAAKPKNVKRAESASKVLFKDSVIRITAGKGVFYSVLEAKKGDEQGEVVAISPTGTVDKLGPAPEAARLLPTAVGVLAASNLGITVHTKGAAPKKIYSGVVRRAITDGTHVTFMDCGPEEDKGCTLQRLPIAGGEPERFEQKFPVVNSIANWQSKVVVAGRQIDEREGVPLSKSELDEQVKWFQRGGALPPSARYAPGFLALFDASTKKTEYWSFVTQRPAEVAADGDDLYLMTEGSPSAAFTNGALVRITPKGSWTVLAYPLSTPERLAISPTHICWTEMPSGKFTVRCFNKKTEEVQVMVEQEKNVFDYALSDGFLTWTSLSGPVQQIPLL